MKPFIAFLLISFLFACSSEKVAESNAIHNPFITPQTYYIIEALDIDSIVDYDDLDYNLLLNTGKKKIFIHLKIDPMRNHYRHKYLAYQSDASTMPLSIYTNTELKEDVRVKLQKYAQSETVNCMINDKPCWCLFE